MGIGALVKAVLFALFGALSAAVSLAVEPTYDRLFVPEMSPSALFAPWTGGGLFGGAVRMSSFLLVNVVDPFAVLVIAGVGVLYLARASLPSLAGRLQDLGPRLLLGILIANLAVPLAQVIFLLGAAVYPVFYAYQGGAWQSYANLVGPAGLSVAWDNGLLALIGALALLGMTLLLAFLVAFRDALLAVLLVLLPIFTLFWPWPFASSLASRGWKLFVEMTFLPCFLVVPLALAVGSQSVLIVLALFGLALGMPSLLSLGGRGLGALGSPSPAGFVAAGLGRGPGMGVDSVGGVAQHGTRSFRSSFPRGGAGARPTAPWPSAALGPASAVVWGIGEGVGKLAHHLGSAANRHLGHGGGGSGASPAMRTRPPSALRDVPGAARGRPVA